MLLKEGDRRNLGSKGFNLYRCVLLGVRVPEFFIVPTNSHAIIDENEAARGLRDDLRMALNALGGLVSVRSSSVAEDLGDHSNAGQFKTVLNVRNLEDLERALVAVWQSAHGKPMAVIIQKMLRPEMAGVVFTRDPVNGERELIIEHVKGLGEALVSGRKDPERIVVHEGGVLDNGHPFDELVRTARRLEEGFGRPLDIEWAVCNGALYILQARPITRLRPPKPEDAQSYSRVHAEEFFSGPVSTLFFSVFKELYTKYYLQETLDALKVTLPFDGPFMVRHKNHLYTATAPLEYLLSGVSPKFGKRRSMEVLPPDLSGKAFDRKRSGGRWDILKVVGFIATNPRLWISNLDVHFRDKVVPEIIRRLDALEDLHELSDEELVRVFGELMDITASHIRVSKWGLVLYSIALTEAMDRFLRKNGIDESKLSLLMVGLQDNRTLDATLELRGLAEAMKRVPRALDILRAEHGDYEIYKMALLKILGGALLIEHFDSIIVRYGHRRLSRDLRAPSWSDDPMVPFRIVRSLALEASKPRKKEVEAMEGPRCNALKDIESALPLGKRGVFKVLGKYLTRYTAFREFQRFYLDMILAKMRGLVLEIAERMVQDGSIADVDDVFFLEIEDLTGHLLGKCTTGPSKKALFNRLSFEDEQGTPGRYLRGRVDFDAVEVRSDVSGTDGAIVGQPVSAGSYVGTVRVVASLDSNVEIEQGDVLVTRCLDPGQTHFLMRAGALILEVGGMLSHGAIIARELGIPTVAQVREATSRLKSGQRVLVDGNRGTIEEVV